MEAALVALAATYSIVGLLVALFLQHGPSTVFIHGRPLPLRLSDLIAIVGAAVLWPVVIWAVIFGEGEVNDGF
jgi:hypothetical protein